MVQELGAVILRRAAHKAQAGVEQPARCEPPPKAQGVAASDVEKRVVPQTRRRPQPNRKASASQRALGRIAEIREAPSAEQAQRIAPTIDPQGGAIEGG